MYAICALSWRATDVYQPVAAAAAVPDGMKRCCALGHSFLVDEFTQFCCHHDTDIWQVDVLEWPSYHYRHRYNVYTNGIEYFLFPRTCDCHDVTTADDIVAVYVIIEWQAARTT